MKLGKKELKILTSVLIAAWAFSVVVYAQQTFFVDSNTVQVHVSSSSSSLAVNKNTGLVGEVFTFTGTVMIDGVGAASVPVDLMIIGSPTPVTSSATDSNGGFTIDWSSESPGDFTFFIRATVVV